MLSSCSAEVVREATAHAEVGRDILCAGASMGLAYKTLQQREKPFKDKAEAQVGDVQKSLSLLLKYFPLRLGGDFPTIIITWDGYSPYSAFRSQLARKRLAVAATNGLEATNFLTVADKKKSTFHDWWVFTFLPQLSNIQQRILRKGGFEFSLIYYKIGGDHAELTSLFKGVGPGGHRSAFCATAMQHEAEQTARNSGEVLLFPGHSWTSMERRMKKLWRRRGHLVTLKETKKEETYRKAAVKY